MIAPRVSVLLISAAFGCDPYDGDLGPQPFFCGDSFPRCPGGYVCVERPTREPVCLRDDVAADADTSILQCGADAMLEPNETIDAASALPIPESGETHTLAAVVCPETDLDFYRLNVDVTGKNVRVEVIYDSRRGLLEVDLLNSLGVSIRKATPTNGVADKLRADFNNLASGAYYGRIQGMGVRTNYETSFIITADTLPP